LFFLIKINFVFFSLVHRNNHLIDLTHINSRRPKGTELHNIISNNFEKVIRDFNTNQHQLPKHIRDSFYGFLNCSDPRFGLLRAHCSSCNGSKFISFSCKKRGICPTCSGRVMSQTAANLVDKVIPKVKVRQWVLSFPFRIRYLMAYDQKNLNLILGIYYRAVRSFYLKRARLYGHKNIKVGAITFIQRFGGSVNLNVHFHTLFVDGYFYKSIGIKKRKEEWIYQKVKAISDQELTEINRKIIKRIYRSLKRRGIIEEFEEGNLQFNFPDFDDGLRDVYESSITRKQRLEDRSGPKIKKIGQHSYVPWTPPVGRRLSYIDGFSLHANISVGAKNREFLERLIRYVARPSLSYEKISEDESGNVIFKLKNPYEDGTTHLKFTPTDFIEKIISIMPPPRMNLIRYQGFFAPNCKKRKYIILKSKDDLKAGKNGKDKKRKSNWIKWADLLKRVFKEDALKCKRCGGQMSIVGKIFNKRLIEEIVQYEYLDDAAREEVEKQVYRFNNLRAPP